MSEMMLKRKRLEFQRSKCSNVSKNAIKNRSCVLVVHKHHFPEFGQEYS